MAFYIKISKEDLYDKICNHFEYCENCPLSKYRLAPTCSEDDYSNDQILRAAIDLKMNILEVKGL